MTYFNKRNPWFWAFIVLLILNVSAIGTMIYTINKIHSGVEFPPPPPPTEQKMPSRMGKILEKQMGYSKAQMKVLRSIRKEHLVNMRAFQIKLRKLQTELFNEISSTQPEEKKVDSLKAALLETHASMIDESNTFYYKVKKNSNEEQLKKLNKFYKRMLFHHPMPPNHPKKNKQ